MPISIVIPFHRHISELQRCLSSLSKQESLPSEVIVVLQDKAHKAHEVLDIFKAQQGLSDNIKKIFERLKVVNVPVPCQVAAINMGIEEAMGEVVTVADENAVPYLQIRPEDWPLIRR